MLVWQVHRCLRHHSASWFIPCWVWPWALNVRHIFQWEGVPCICPFYEGFLFHWPKVVGLFSLLWAHTHMLSFSLNPHGALYLTLEDSSLLFISHSQVMSFNCPTTWWLQASGCWCLVASATASSWSSSGSTQLSSCWPRPCFLTLSSH